MTNGKTISVAMIVCNEENNLPRTLEGLRWVDEIVMVDSGSVDRTPEIAQSYGARLSFNRDFRGHGAQKNIAIGQCKCDWVFLLDADEVVTQELAQEVQRTLVDPKYDAYWVPRLNLFTSRWMRHGGLYPDRKLRLFRRGVTQVEPPTGAHGTPQFSGPKGTLKNHLLHYAYPDFTLYLEHMNSYSSGSIESSLLRYRRTPLAILVLKSFLNPLFGFLKNYVFRLGFMDGAEGMIFHLNHAIYVHWKYVKLWEIRSRMTGNGVQPISSNSTSAVLDNGTHIRSSK